MGRIANSRRPGALKLFQDVMIAPASIPAVPPVLIRAEVDGKRISEMHADGGTAVKVFALPDGVPAAASTKGLPGTAAGAELYMIVNYTLAPGFQVTTDSTLQVGQRGPSTPIKAQTRSSVVATHGFAKQAGIRSRLASIDKTFLYDSADPFDTDYMREFFAFGHDRAVTGTLWNGDLKSDLFIEASPTRPAPSGRKYSTRRACIRPRPEAEREARRAALREEKGPR